ncbi:MAG: ABC transporter ATP-binding protein [Actinomycetota bacterium]|nr:ABC transporter ATP-binding protein [Actinomycetota bacterium]
MSLEAAVNVRLDGFELDVVITVGSGELVAVLGPNGAGKSMLLRALAGLVPLTAGRVTLDTEILEDTASGMCVPPEQRPVGVVFQDYRLFPYLSALDNVAFGLRCKGVPRTEARRRAQAWLGQVSLTDRAGAHPGQLSGGQSQRVALARALATEPALLLLDEPLSALDVTARGEARRELRRHLASYGGVRLLVTHDPLEALVLADRVVVLENGRVVQIGAPAEVAARPRSQWVADLAGVNLLRGEAKGDSVELVGGDSLMAAGAGKGQVFAVIHPRAVALHSRPPEGTPRNVWKGVTTGIDPEGDRVRVRVNGSVPIVAEVTPMAVADLGLEAGRDVWVSVKATEVAVYPA